VQLQEGTNTITVWAYDLAGNSRKDTLIVNCTPDRPPTVMIESPASTGTFTTTDDTIVLAGTASDDGEVGSVEWSLGGTQSSCNGKETWDTDPIPLEAGDNVITIAVTDDGGQESTASITVTRTVYEPPFAEGPVQINGAWYYRLVSRDKPTAFQLTWHMWDEAEQQMGSEVGQEKWDRATTTDPWVMNTDTFTAND
jgi:hypothetical protein